MNLVPDKFAAYRETYRILKPGGHFSISDIVFQGEIPAPLQKAAELYAGCVSGAIQKEDYLKIVSEAGFEEITVRKEDRINLTADILNQFLTTDQIDALSEAEVGIYSITVNAKKPVDKTCCDSACCAD
jgi:ubiquinone/menaquinone biosynthesis C-methylase UbiE